MSSISGFSPTNFLSSSGDAAQAGGSSSPIDALYEKIKKVMEEIKELAHDESMDAEAKMKLILVKQAQVQVYHSQIMAIQMQEMKEAMLEEVGQAAEMVQTQLDSTSEASPHKEAKEAESVIVHIAENRLNGLEENEDTADLLAETPKEESETDVLRGPLRAINEYV